MRNKMGVLTSAQHKRPFLGSTFGSKDGLLFPYWNRSIKVNELKDWRSVDVARPSPILQRMYQT
jgi:hypothetical protein